MGFTVSINSEEDTPDNITIAFTWDMSFNSNHVVVEYRIIVTMLDIISCPISCSPNKLCQCNGTQQLAKDGVSITISAVNCNEQEGPNATVILKPQGLTDHDSAL